MALIEKLTDIADAIRSKTGDTSPMSLADMASTISALDVGLSNVEEGIYSPYNDPFPVTAEEKKLYWDINKQQLWMCTYAPNSISSRVAVGPVLLPDDEPVSPKDQWTPLTSTSNYTIDEQCIGTWIDGSYLFKKTFQVTSGLAKDNLINVGKVNSWGVYESIVSTKAVIKTTEGSYSSSDILVYVTADGDVMCKQNFTSYPEKLWVTIEYTKQ